MLGTRKLSAGELPGRVARASLAKRAGAADLAISAFTAAATLLSGLFSTYACSIRPPLPLLGEMPTVLESCPGAVTISWPALPLKGWRLECQPRRYACLQHAVPPAAALHFRSAI